MSFVTTMYLRSGDRAALEDVVEEIRETAERKGAKLKGPHSKPPKDLRVPLYDDVDGEPVSRWDHTVYSREIEIVGHDDLARRIAGREFPESVHVEVEVEQQNPTGAA